MRPHQARCRGRSEKIAFFNHKVGVGKTTLTVNVADALEDIGKTALLVDADPQSNLTAFYIPEADLEELFSDEDPEEGDRAKTLWSAIRHVVAGRGGVRKAEVWDVGNNDGKVLLLPGDVMMSQYEEELPTAWIDTGARGRPPPRLRASPVLLMHMTHADNSRTAMASRAKQRGGE